MNKYLGSHKRAVHICFHIVLCLAIVADICGVPGIALAIRPLHLFIVSSRLVETIAFAD